MNSENFNDNEILARIKPTFIATLIPIKSRVGRYKKYRFISTITYVDPPRIGLDTREEMIKRSADGLGLTYRIVSDQEWCEAIKYATSY